MPTERLALSGSIGALRATVEYNWQVADLAEVERAWAKLPAIKAHKPRSRDLEPDGVSVTARWTISRVV